MEFHSMLPVFENPAFTEGYEGFAHLTDMRGEVESARLRYIIRDHDRDKFEQRKARFTKIAAYLNEKYGDCISLSLKDGYYNMKEAILPHPQILELAQGPPCARWASSPTPPPCAAERTAPASPSWAFPAPTSTPAA